MRVRLQRLEGASSVTVSLNDGRAEVRFEPGNAIRLEQLRDIVRQGGFTPRDARVEVRGEVRREAERAVLVVAGTDERYELRPAGEQDLRIAEFDGRTIVIEGTVPALVDERKRPDVEPLLVETIREERGGDPQE